MRYLLSGDRERDGFHFTDSLPFVWKVSFVADDAVLNLKFCRRRAHINRLVRQFHEFIEIKRAIVQRARQTKPVIYEHSFA